MPACVDPPGQESSGVMPSELEPDTFRYDDLTTYVKHMRHELLKQMDSLELLIKQRDTGRAHQKNEAIAHVLLEESPTAATTVSSALEDEQDADELQEKSGLNQGEISLKPSTILANIDRKSSDDEQGEFDDECSHWRDFASHRYFRGFVMVAVCLNALALGASLEFVGPTWDKVWLVVGHTFAALFAIEMVIKIACWGFRTYFFGVEAGWNILDFLCAWIGILGNWMIPLITGSTNESGGTVYRLLRVVRLAKLVHANKNLAVLAEGMIASLRSLIWVAVLLVVVLYAFAVGLIMSGIGEDFSFGSHWNAQYFGTLFRAMVSLFGVCIGAEWTSIIWPVIDDGKPATMLVFVAFIFIAQFGFLNIIVGVIVDRTNAATQKQKDQEANLETQHKMSVVRALGAKMHLYDVSTSGGLTFEEFTALLLAPENQELRTIVKKDLPIGFRARDLHSILEDDVDGNLTRQEFEDGIERLISATPFQERLLNQHRQAKMINEIKTQSRSLRMEIRGLMAEIKGQLGRDHPDNKRSSQGLTWPHVTII